MEKELTLREAVQAIINRWDNDRNDYRARVMIMQLKASLAALAEKPAERPADPWLYAISETNQEGKESWHDGEQCVFGDRESAQDEVDMLNDAVTEGEGSSFKLVPLYRAERPQLSAEQVRGALARGYCHKSNSYKILDSELCEAMKDEIMALLTGVAEPPTQASPDPLFLKTPLSVYSEKIQEHMLKAAAAPPVPQAERAAAVAYSPDWWEGYRAGHSDGGRVALEKAALHANNRLREGGYYAAFAEGVAREIRALAVSGAVRDAGKEGTK